MNIDQTAIRVVRRTDTGIETLMSPRPTGNGVRVRVTSAGICGSDLHATRTGPLPFVLGHEFGGRLLDGTLVAVQPSLPCGTCPSCLRGEEQTCAAARRSFHGASLDGGLADEVLVDPRLIVPVPEGVDETVVALVEPIAVAVHAVERARPRDGERVLVVGGGTIGLLCAGVLHDRGIDVDLSARHPHQVTAAQRLGARTEVSGRYSLVIDAAATTSSFEQTLRAAEDGGRIVLVGLPWEPLSFGMALVLREINLVPAIFYTRADLAEAAAVLSRHPEFADILVTHRFPLEKADEAFRVAGDRASGAIKVHLLP
jgi:2-desacetyl-2-hydroxyethyl bacteriochlorophyllide A dehydrogenase